MIETAINHGLKRASIVRLRRCVSALMLALFDPADPQRRAKITPAARMIAPIATFTQHRLAGHINGGTTDIARTQHTLQVLLIIEYDLTGTRWTTFT